MLTKQPYLLCKFTRFYQRAKMWKALADLDGDIAEDKSLRSDNIAYDVSSDKTALPDSFTEST